MKIKGAIMLTGVAVFMLVMQSCEKEGGNETNISQAGGHSHNAGRNCMSCHASGGEGKGWFNAAGTVYNTNDSLTTFTNPVMKLYTAPDTAGNQTLVTTINGDASGNFYTTASIDYGTGLFPMLVGAHGSRYMNVTITTGACNSCHGVSTGRLVAN